jgi:hypothetical protein
MSHSAHEEILELYDSFMDQIDELNKSLEEIRGAMITGKGIPDKIIESKELLGKMRERIDYTLENYNV